MRRKPYLWNDSWITNSYRKVLKKTGLVCLPLPPSVCIICTYTYPAVNVSLVWCHAFSGAFAAGWLVPEAEAVGEAPLEGALPVPTRRRVRRHCLHGLCRRLVQVIQAVQHAWSKHIPWVGLIWSIGAGRGLAHSSLSPHFVALRNRWSWPGFGLGVGSGQQTAFCGRGICGLH